MLCLTAPQVARCHRARVCRHLKMLALWLLTGQCSALAPTPMVARPMASVYRSPGIQMGEAQEREIASLKAKLEEARATIAKLSSSPPQQQTPKVFGRSEMQADEAIEDSRFPLFRKVQSSISQSYLEYIDGKKKDEPAPSVEQLFSKYDADRSGLLDINEFREMVKEMNLPVDLSVPNFGAMANDTVKSAENLISDAGRAADGFGKSVLGSVNDLAKGVNDLAASAGVPGATASVPVTLVGGLGSGDHAGARILDWPRAPSLPRAISALTSRVFEPACGKATRRSCRASHQEART